MSGVRALSLLPPLACAKTTTNAMSTTATPIAVKSTVRPRLCGAGGGDAGSVWTSTIARPDELGGNGRALGGGGGGHRIDRSAPAARERRQQGADGDDGRAEPEPDDERHGANRERRRAVGVGC